MVGAKQRGQVARHCVADVVCEGVVRAALDDTLFEENVEISVQSEAAENNDNLNILKEFYLFLEI